MINLFINLSSIIFLSIILITINFISKRFRNNSNFQKYKTILSKICLNFFFKLHKTIKGPNSIPFPNLLTYATHYMIEPTKYFYKSFY